MTTFSEQNQKATAIWLTRRRGFKRPGFDTEEAGRDSVNGISLTGESGVAARECDSSALSTDSKGGGLWRRLSDLRGCERSGNDTELRNPNGTFFELDCEECEDCTEAADCKDSRRNPLLC